MKFLDEEERDVLQEIMDEQASQEKKHKGERTLAGYWSKIRSASQNPVTFAAAAWGFFYFWAYVSFLSPACTFAGTGWGVFTHDASDCFCL
jgi:hypothetical protein